MNKQENKLILQPGDYLVTHYGLKLENIGDYVIDVGEFSAKISSPVIHHIEKIEIDESSTKDNQ